MELHSPVHIARGAVFKTVSGTEAAVELTEGIHSSLKTASQLENSFPIDTQRISGYQ
jgi:hypothetical protein